jgi:nitrogen regulatory protein PII
MKRVEMTVHPAKLEDVKDALTEAGVPSMTVREARVFDTASRRHKVFRGSSYVVDFALKVTIEMVVQDDIVPGILEAIEKSAEIGVGDGRVFIFDVVEAVRIRTNEHGEKAIDSPATISR